MTTRGATSLRAIGARAGVSASTAARALRHDVRITTATRHRVEQALAELRAEASTVAQDAPSATSSRRTGLASPLAGAGLIAVLVPESTRPRPASSVYLATLQAVREVAEARGVGVVLTSYTSDPGENSYGDFLLKERAIAGAVIVRTHGQDERFEKLRASGVPFVVVNRVFGGRFAPPYVGVDHREIGRLATTHLHDLGHRRIAFARFRADVTSLALRYEGYADALTAAGLPLDERLVVEAPFSLDGAREAARELLARFWGDGAAASQRPTALVSLSDRHAIAAIDELRSAGRRIPCDLSVVGADDAEEAADAGLTTVRVPWREMARAATEALLSILSVRGVRRFGVVLEATLVRRASTAPPAEQTTPPAST